MTKDELKAYISEAVDALDPVDLEQLFPPNNQPDLYTIVEELTSLKGEFSKLSGSNLKLNHEIHGLVEQVALQQSQQENFLLSLKEEEKKETTLHPELKALLLKLLKMDELIHLAEESYRELPELGFFNKNKYKNRLASWQKGFDITIDRWKKLLQSSSLYKTGLAGEPFDPELHEAIAVKHQNHLEDNIILETEQAGFLYKGQLVRLAKVVVNKVKKTKVIEVIPPKKEKLEIAPVEVEPDVKNMKTEEQLEEDIVNQPQKRSSKWKTKKKKKLKKKKRKKKRK